MKCVTGMLDPDNKAVRGILRDSLKVAQISYSNWIKNLSNEETPCDAFGLYLLCQTYKRHAVVLTSSKCWCTFKPGNRTLFDKLVKVDTVLLWLGDNRFAEVKPLKKITSSLGPLLEWQLMSDSIKHVHEKRITDKCMRKPRKSTNVSSLLEREKNRKVRLTLTIKTCIVMESKVPSNGKFFQGLVAHLRAGFYHNK